MGVTKEACHKTEIAAISNHQTDLMTTIGTIGRTHRLTHFLMIVGARAHIITGQVIQKDLFIRNLAIMTDLGQIDTIMTKGTNDMKTKTSTEITIIKRQIKITK